MLRYAFDLEHESENPKSYSEACLPANVRVCVCVCIHACTIYGHKLVGCDGTAVCKRRLLSLLLLLLLPGTGNEIETD